MWKRIFVRFMIIGEVGETAILNASGPDSASSGNSWYEERCEKMRKGRKERTVRSIENVQYGG